MSSSIKTCALCKERDIGGMYDGDVFTRCPYCFMRGWNGSPVAIFQGFRILTKASQTKLAESIK